MRDEWRTDELAVVASLTSNLHLLTSVDKIHCFPTACVDKWLHICLRLGPQLKYLQARFFNPTFCNVALFCGDHENLAYGFVRSIIQY